MIFITIGILLLVIGVYLALLPKNENMTFFSYRTYRATLTLDIWRVAQKIAARHFAVSGVGLVILGIIFRYRQFHFFFVELILLLLLVFAVFVWTEKKIQEYIESKSEGE